MHGKDQAQVLVIRKIELQVFLVRDLAGT